MRRLLVVSLNPHAHGAREPREWRMSKHVRREHLEREHLCEFLPVVDDLSAVHELDLLSNYEACLHARPLVHPASFRALGNFVHTYELALADSESWSVDSIFLCDGAGMKPSKQQKRRRRVSRPSEHKIANRHAELSCCAIRAGNRCLWAYECLTWRATTDLETASGHRRPSRSRSGEVLAIEFDAVTFQKNNINKIVEDR
jgi:hypothetical protein